MINVIQFITFHMNLKLTNVTLGFTIFTFDVSISDFAGEDYIRILKTTFSVNADRNLAL